MCADPSVRPPLLLVHAWLKRLVQKFAALVARAEAGTLRPPRRGRHRSPSEGPPGKPRPRWPTNFAWLIKMLPHEAAYFGSQLQHQFSQPEMMALLEAAPQAGRLLRPLCRMLAVELPPGPASPAEAAQAAKTQATQAATPRTDLRRRTGQRPQAQTSTLQRRGRDGFCVAPLAGHLDAGTGPSSQTRLRLDQPTHAQNVTL
jgi:hypothetical protein